jgi:iron-sulfur cluster repair protein YtfE (RIC family)
MAERNETLREIGLFALGTAAGLVLGRIGAPLAAKTAGMARAAAGGADAFEELTADHKRVLTALDQAERVEGRARMPLFLLIKRELSKHAIAEEDVVYPLIGEKLHAVDAARHLYEEHGEVKTLLAEIEEALEADDDLRYRDRIRILRDTVRTHAQREETEWFPQLRQALDDKKRAIMTGKVDREKAMLA